MTETYCKHPRDCPDCAARHVRSLREHIRQMRMHARECRVSYSDLRAAEEALAAAMDACKEEANSYWRQEARDRIAALRDANATSLANMGDRIAALEAQLHDTQLDNDQMRRWLERLTATADFEPGNGNVEISRYVLRQARAVLDGQDATDQPDPGYHVHTQAPDYDPPVSDVTFDDILADEGWTDE